MKIELPHIPLGISLEEGIEILSSVATEVEKYEEEKEDFYKVSSGESEFGFYTKDNLVHASWYNDPSGRDSEEGINTKVTLYLMRYGQIDGWEDGINNGWIQFFTNEQAKVGMSYGLHKDVLRFNQID